MSWPRTLVVLALPTCVFAQQSAAGEPCSQVVPAEVLFDSNLGAVLFAHEFHTDMEIPCEDCHHETLASGLSMPHPDYFEDFWIRCETCHHAGAEPGCPQKCSVCHHSSPATAADETLSSKVVLHQSCWECHPSGTGSEASRGCDLCHQRETRSESE
jgi:hypothetical protein